ncbi:MAG: ERF family protein [Clostridia bacterium]|nr:ERF family protein [Clostridia bacterium]
MNIYESLAAVQADVDFIGKDKQVQSGGTYKYRGVDQVLNTLHPLFAKHKVFAVPEVLEIMEREIRKTAKGSEVLYQVLKVKYTFYAEDGTSVSAVVVGEAMDSGDKVSNKCMSVAYKYACFQILSIPTEETCADPDDDNEPLNQNDKKPPKKAQSNSDDAFAAEDYKCAVCGRQIDKKLFDQTVKAYGTPLCSPECKKTLIKAGEISG